MRIEVLQGVRILSAVGGLCETAGILGDAFTAPGRRIVDISADSLYTASFSEVGREKIIKRVGEFYILKKRTHTPSAVSGPASLRSCKETVLIMSALGAERSVIVSDILAASSPEVCDGVAIMARDQDEYDYIYSRLNLPEINIDIATSAIIGDEVTPIDFVPIGRGRDIASMIMGDTEAVFIKGAVTFSLVMDIIGRHRDITIIGEHPASFVMDRGEWAEINGKVGLACVKKAPILLVISDRHISARVPFVEV